MPEITCRTMLYKAFKCANGRVVCVDADYLAHTTKIVSSQGEYDLSRSLGWCDDPQAALDQFEREECQLGEDAAVRAYDDRRLSDGAKTEAQQVESTTVRHLPDIPEAPKKRGRPKKTVQ